jgi:hypothetical protein
MIDGALQSMIDEVLLFTGKLSGQRLNCAPHGAI